MATNMDSLKTYLDALPKAQRTAMEKLLGVVRTHLPEGFSETFHDGMIHFEVPLSLYPKGYHAKKGAPLPFLSLAAQKSHIALYHMGLYGDPTLQAWFEDAYEREVPTKLDMGKSCVRFRNPEKIPLELIGTLCEKVTVEAYVQMVEGTVGGR